MPQDGYNESAPHAQPMDSQGLLQVVLLAYNDKGERAKDGDRYAAIKFPQTYEDAMSSIQQSLGRYLEGGPKSIDSVDILCPMSNIDDEWIWAEVNKKDWALIVEELPQTRKILAIRQRLNASKAQEESDQFFTRGAVIITYGKTKGGLTSWGEVPGNGTRALKISATPTINRPASYKEAIDLITQGAEHGPNGKWWEHQDISNMGGVNQVVFKFYYFLTKRGGFPSTDAWVEFPAEAYDNEKIWRAFVPKFHELLGYTLHPKM